MAEALIDGLGNGSSYWLKLDNLAGRDVSYDWNLGIHEHC